MRPNTELKEHKKDADRKLNQSQSRTRILCNALYCFVVFQSLWCSTAERRENDRYYQLTWENNGCQEMLLFSHGHQRNESCFSQSDFSLLFVSYSSKAGDDPLLAAGGVYSDDIVFTVQRLPGCKCSVLIWHWYISLALFAKKQFVCLWICKVRGVCLCCFRSRGRPVDWRDTWRKSIVPNRTETSTRGETVHCDWHDSPDIGSVLIGQPSYVPTSFLP